MVVDLFMASLSTVYVVQGVDRETRPTSANAGVAPICVPVDQLLVRVLVSAYWTGSIAPTVL